MLFYLNTLDVLLLALSVGIPSSLPSVSSSANAVNDAGLIVGSRCYADSTCHAALWVKDQFVYDLGVLPGGTWSAATAINNAGRVVGYGNVSTDPTDTRTHAVLWSAGEIHDLGVLPGDVSSQAIGINNAGVIAGNSCQPAPPLQAAPCRAWFYHSSGKDNGVMRPLDFLLEGTTTSATAINSRGQIVGYGDGKAGASYPDIIRKSQDLIIWNPDGTVKFHYGSPFSPYQAWAMNDNGAVVGPIIPGYSFLLANETFMPFNVTGLGPVNHISARGINNKLQVVGTNSGDHPTLAFFWNAGVTTYLERQLGWGDSIPVGINEDGLVVGWLQDYPAPRQAVMWENGALKHLK